MTTVSLSGKPKVVILDEADYLNVNSVQPALRNFMEEFSSNARFILTANYANKIIPPLHSRCSVVEFKIKNSDKPKLMGQMMMSLAIVNMICFKKGFFQRWYRYIHRRVIGWQV